MSETEQMMNEIMMNIQRGNYSMNMIARSGAAAVLQIYQLICRLHRERLLSGGEVRKFEQFMKATGGKYEILRLPYPSQENPDSIKEMVKKELDAMGIRYHILPDLNENDKAYLFCIYQDDRQKFGTFFQDYLNRQLSGGSKRPEDILSLTARRVSILSIPGEGRLREITEDFDRLGVNYAALPDLYVGDGQVQFLVADADLPKVRHWYGLYQETLIREGKRTEDLKDLTVSQYQSMAAVTPEDYLNSASEEVRAAITPYEGTKKGEVEQKLGQLQPDFRSTGTEAYVRFLQDPGYVKISVDADTLVYGQAAEDYRQKDGSHFYCRIPETFGEGEETLCLPAGQVFLMQDSARPRYIGFVSRSEPPMVLNRKGEKIYTYKTGEDLFDRFDRRKETFLERQMKPIQQAAKVIPKAPPVLNR